MGRVKQFKTVDEQIEIMRDKGLTIKSDLRTKDILLRENYFFINGYRHVFMRISDSKRFIDGATFEELYSLFCFDRNIRNIMFKYLLIVENNLKLRCQKLHPGLSFPFHERETLFQALRPLR